MIRNNQQLLGNWPIPGKTARQQKKMMIIKPEDTLDFIHGSKNHMLVSFAVSNDYIHFGTITLPAGVCSDVEVHKGDEVFYVLEGTVSILCPQSDEAESVSKSRYEVSQGERFLLPENTPHRYLNLSDKVSKIIFAIAPEL